MLTAKDRDKYSKEAQKLLSYVAAAKQNPTGKYNKQTAVYWQKKANEITKILSTGRLLPANPPSSTKLVVKSSVKSKPSKTVVPNNTSLIASYVKKLNDLQSALDAKEREFLQLYHYAFFISPSVIAKLDQKISFTNQMLLKARAPALQKTLAQTKKSLMAEREAAKKIIQLDNEIKACKEEIKRRGR